MTRDGNIENYLKLQYLRDIAQVQWKHRAYLSSTDEKFMTRGQRTSDVKSDIRSLREEMRATGINAYRRRNHMMIKDRIWSIMGINLGTKRDAVVQLGKHPVATRSKSYGAYRYSITVGHMWFHKVWTPLYAGTTLADEKWLVLKAELVRVNDKWISLYEVLAYNYETDETANAYVAQTKTEKRHTAFGKTVKQAVSKANGMLERELNKALLGNVLEQG